ncbi:MAG: ribonuclease P protein component [Bacteroides sp.]|nr:ribonuclease P protein component [Bacteroides sp.]MBD5332458.1 ribonuclease P protein component [Bacteroides sp.]
MKGLRLYKIEKLCSETAISRLFSRGSREVSTSLVYPLRLAWRVDRERSVECPRFLVSIPKKRLRHAVDRVKMRRRVREAYRLSRHLLDRELPVDLAFIYVADEILPYDRVLSSVRRLLTRVADAAADDNSPATDAEASSPSTTAPK